MGFRYADIPTPLCRQRGRADGSGGWPGRSTGGSKAAKPAKFPTPAKDSAALPENSAALFENSAEKSKNSAALFRQCAAGAAHIAKNI